MLTPAQKEQIFVRLRNEVDEYIGVKFSSEERFKDRLVYVDLDKFDEQYNTIAESVAEMNAPEEYDENDEENDDYGAFMDSTLKHQVFSYSRYEQDFPNAARAVKMHDNDISSLVAWYMLYMLEEVNGVDIDPDSITFADFNSGEPNEKYEF